MSWFVGTSGYSYKEWKGPFYPEKIKNDDMLSYFASKLTSVEINNTFYRMPRESVVESWAEQVPETFRFSMKASRRITHFGRLGDVQEHTQYMFRALSPLGLKLGVVLFQLPPNFKKDIEKLNNFLPMIPRRIRAAFEFRHESWFDDDVFDALKSKNSALVIADTDEDCTPLVATADWGYLRLRRASYRKPGLEKWVKNIDELGFKDSFVFFKHEDAGAGPKAGMKFLGLIDQ